jgi:thioester reductase-like protein
MCVVKAFDDHETVQKLEDNFKRTYERTVREWNDKVLPILHEFYEDS